MHAWPTRHPQLANTFTDCFQFFSFLIKEMLALSCNFGVTSCSSVFTHPAAHTHAHLALTSAMHTEPPFYPNCTKRVPIHSSRAQESIDISKIRWKCPRKFWRVAKPPRGTTHPRPPRIGPIYKSIDSSQSQDSEYIIINGIDP